MFRFGFVLASLLMVAPCALAEDKLPPVQSLFTFKEPYTSQQEDRTRSVALQLQIRQQNFLAQDRDSFNRRDTVTFITPTDRGREDKRLEKPKLLFGVVVRF